MVFLVIDKEGNVVGETTDVTEKIFMVKPKGKKIKGVLQFRWNDTADYVVKILISAIPVVTIGLLFSVHHIPCTPSDWIKVFNNYFIV